MSRVLLPLVVAVMLLPVGVMAVVASAPEGGGAEFSLFANIAEMFAGGGFPVYFGNSLILSFGIGLLDVLFAGASGYALARLRFRGRKALFALVVVTLALSPTVVMVPVYVIVHQLGWIDTYQGMIVPSMISAFGVFLVRQFALGLPEELLLAARVDGAGEFRIFATIAVPLLRPALLTLFLLQFLTQWDNLLWPLLVANDPALWPLPVGISQLQTEIGYDIRLMTTAALVTAVPPIVVMFFLQRYYVAGLTLGGVKK
ncbi:carbohydrate ABC transporter permease [Nonomuraea deserti]|uniref:Carbohydrate ABC transporter permease n=1 Tax=Nonomuraea deserti TaxID=1848322 RepID=A0A4R4VRE2_9ACTN|nr:carbohydrate ABC transporter permease [Nonomuraea deserti]TDD02740.1 carbohydrate ABC transporter permease [Nonomuraea deserti]